MPSFAVIDGTPVCGMKTITVFPANKPPLSAHQGSVLLFDGEDGRLLSTADVSGGAGGAAESMFRTECASAVHSFSTSRVEHTSRVSSFDCVDGRRWCVCLECLGWCMCIRASACLRASAYAVQFLTQVCTVVPSHNIQGTCSDSNPYCCGFCCRNRLACTRRFEDLVLARYGDASVEARRGHQMCQAYQPGPLVGKKRRQSEGRSKADSKAYWVRGASV